MKTFPIYETGRIRAILDRAPVCFAAVVDAEGAPYAFPMNFGYDGRFFYLHSGPEHSALPLLRRDGRICLTLSVRNELMFQDEAVGCSYRMKAESVVVRGTVDFPEALDETGPMGQAFMDFARRVVEETDRRNAEQAPTHIVEVKK